MHGGAAGDGRWQYQRGRPRGGQGALRAGGTCEAQREGETVGGAREMHGRCARRCVECVLAQVCQVGARMQSRRRTTTDTVRVGGGRGGGLRRRNDSLKVEEGVVAEEEH